MINDSNIDLTEHSDFGRSFNGITNISFENIGSRRILGQYYRKRT